MNRYFINIIHDGIITMKNMMLDIENLASAKVIVEETMKEHNSINATILDRNFNKIVEYRNGEWR